MENQTLNNEDVEQVITQEEPTMIDQPTTVNKPTYDDRHKQVNVWDEDKLTPYSEAEEKTLGESIILPTSDYHRLKKFLDIVSNLDEDTINSTYTEEQKDISRMGALSMRYTTKDNIYVDNINKEDEAYVNRLKYGDKNLNIKELKFDSETKKLSPTQAALVFKTLLSVGEAVQVPLWHSGFWISLKPPTQTDIINLQIALTNSEIELGRDTNTLIYSNYGVIFNRIISDFIVKHIEYTTLALPENEDIRDYISIQDFQPLVLGIVSTMYPKGINVVKACVSAAKLGSDKKPKCDYAVSGVIDPKKLLWVDRTQLSEKMLSHMSNRLDSSVTVNNVKEYQLSIERMLAKDYELEADNGIKIKIKYELPTLKDYITNGERWVNTIIKRAEALYTEADTIDQKNNKINELTMGALLGVYNTFVKSIEVNGTEVTDFEAIMEMLSTISTDDKAFDGFVTTIEEFITSTAISIVATPSYTCPNCKKHQTEDKQGIFKEFIPFNIVEHFFVLCALRVEKTRQRTV